MKTNILFAYILSMLLISCNKDEQREDSYTLDKGSVVEWKGTGPEASHTGSFDVQSKNMTIKNNKVKSGTFIIPIATIKNFDLPDAVKPTFLEHLKSPDFFNLVIYPNAKMTITSISDYNRTADTAITGANFLIKGQFTMLNKTNEVSFPAKILINNEKITVDAIFSIDRTLWGMNYAADPSLGAHYIQPKVDIRLKLKGSKL